jgi:hypothetical protein
MRTEKDIKNIIFTLFGKMEIDMERVEEDPNWIPFANRIYSGLITEEEALKQYITGYFSRESFPRGMPITNGPADFMGLELEVKDVGR